MIDPEFREAVLNLLCPICGKGPYKMLASHTSQKHGIYTWELHDRAGLKLGDSITSEDLREQRVAQGHKIVEVHGPPPGMQKGHRLKRTQAGNQTQREKAAAILSDHDTNARRVQGISRAQKLKYETDEEFRSRITKMQKRQAKLRRKQRECIVCGRKFWRTRETKDRKTCSEQCRDAGRRKGLRIGWASK